MGAKTQGGGGLFGVNDLNRTYVRSAASQILQGLGSFELFKIYEPSISHRQFTSMSISEPALEALVVTGVVARVVWALLGTGSLSFEAAGLVVLTAAAIGLEFVSERNWLVLQLKPRSSMSSGILLGVVTLPVVLSARLVQLLRCSISSGVRPVAVERLRSEFWLALACSTSMLMLLISFLRKHSIGNWMCSTFLEYTSVAVLILLTPKQALNTEWIILWGAVYILGGKTLFSYVLQVFPFSGTVGEVMLVVEGIVLYGANAAASVLSVSTGVSGDLDPEQHLMGALLQGVILGVLIVPLIYKALYQGLPFVLNRTQFVHFLGKESTHGIHVIYKAGLFYAVLLMVIFTAIPRWVGAVISVQLNPVLWALEFVWQQPVKRVLLCAYWVGIICTPLPHIYRISASGQVPKILVRKYYHVMVVFMFVPALLLDPGFLQLAFGVALVGFLVIEMIRVWCLPPFGYWVGQFMKTFTDQRDSGILIISHFSLLLGCALPVWLNSGPGDRPLASFAGILSLGIGDTMASVIGYNFGSIPVSSRSKKTLEGTASGIVSVLLSCLLLVPILSLTTRPALAEGYLSLVAATITGGVLEAYTLQLDNAFIPLLFYSLLCL